MKQLQHEEHVHEQITDILSHEGVHSKDSTDNIHRVINRWVSTFITYRTWQA